MLDAMDAEDVIEFAVDKRYPGLQLTDEQRECLLNIIRDNDIVANLPVGHGKNLLFHLLPDTFRLLERPSKVIVLAPLNSIINDQLRRLKGVGIKAISMDMCGKLMSDDEEISVDDSVRKGEIYLSHPEALLSTDIGNQLLIALRNKVGAICIDECHKVEDWGKDFRRTYSEIGDLRSFFPKIPFLCLSGTMVKTHFKEITKCLNIKPVVIKKSPDLPNTYLEVIKKEKGSSQDIYEEIFSKEIKSLRSNVTGYPVTLMFLPMQYMSFAMRYACRMFPDANLSSAPFGAVFAHQDVEVVNTILSDLKNDSPQYRLVFTTSVLGMGYDSPSITRIIHAKPPRSLTNYVQEIGRAGRRGQHSCATLYFSMSDIASNVPGIQTDIVNYCVSDTCLRSNLLETFGFTKSSESPSGCKCCGICKNNCTCISCQ